MALVLLGAAWTSGCASARWSNRSVWEHTTARRVHEGFFQYSRGTSNIRSLVFGADSLNIPHLLPCILCPLVQRSKGGLKYYDLTLSVIIIIIIIIIITIITIISLSLSYYYHYYFYHHCCCRCHCYFCGYLQYHMQGFCNWLSALGKATASNTHRFLQLLLENGAKVDARNEDENTPLHLTAEHGKIRWDGNSNAGK